MKHIGLIGLAGSGKDTAAKALYSLGYMRYAFADRVKNLAWRFGWDGNKDERGRALLQNIGMAGRQYDPATWIKYVELMIEHETDPELIVFTDVRFQNEADYIRSKGGIIVRIVRPGQIAEKHESELKQCEVAADIEVVNDGSIEDLHNKIRNLIK
jgi:dephospho-CoA kinase